MITIAGVITGAGRFARLPARSGLAFEKFPFKENRFGNQTPFKSFRKSNPDLPLFNTGSLSVLEKPTMVRLTVLYIPKAPTDNANRLQHSSPSSHSHPYSTASSSRESKLRQRRKVVCSYRRVASRSSTRQPCWLSAQGGLTRTARELRRVLLLGTKS